MKSTGYRGALRAHLSACFKQPSMRELSWEHSRLGEWLDDFCVIEIAPAEVDAAWVYVSSGVAVAGDGDEKLRPVEFVLIAPEPDERHVHLLHMVAFYHLSGESLDEGHLFKIGEPWLPGSVLDGMLVSRPYPYGPEFETMHRDGHHAHLMWLTPVSPTEYAFALEHGYDALEAHFESCGMAFADPMRMCTFASPQLKSD